MIPGGFPIALLSTSSESTHQGRSHEERQLIFVQLQPNQSYLLKVLLRYRAHQHPLSCRRLFLVAAHLSFIRRVARLVTGHLLVGAFAGRAAQLHLVLILLGAVILAVICAQVGVSLHLLVAAGAGGHGFLL